MVKADLPKILEIAQAPSTSWALGVSYKDILNLDLKFCYLALFLIS